MHPIVVRMDYFPVDSCLNTWTQLVTFLKLAIFLASYKYSFLIIIHVIMFSLPSVLPRSSPLPYLHVCIYVKV